ARVLCSAAGIANCAIRKSNRLEVVETSTRWEYSNLPFLVFKKILHRSRRKDVRPRRKLRTLIVDGAVTGVSHLTRRSPECWCRVGKVESRRAPGQFRRSARHSRVHGGNLRSRQAPFCGQKFSGDRKASPCYSPTGRKSKGTFRGVTTWDRK